MMAPIGRNGRIAAITGIVALSLVTASSAGWAYWTSQATVNLTASSADLTITTDNFPSLEHVFLNESLAHTGSVTVTNTTVSSSTQGSQVELTFSGTGGDAYRSNFAFTVWLQTGDNPCTAEATPGPALASGTWGDGDTYTTPPDEGFLPDESRIYCVRTTATRATTNWPPNGAMSFTPQISAEIVRGNYSGAASASTTQSSQYIFPVYGPPTADTAWFFIHTLATGPERRCLDVSGGNSAPGATVLGIVCKNADVANQAWRFVPIDGKPGYYQIISNLSNTLAIAAEPTGTALHTATSSPANVQQHWTLQKTDVGFTNAMWERWRYQIVNDGTGLCMTTGLLPGTNGISLAPCERLDTQIFFVVRTMFSGINADPDTDTIFCSFVTGPPAPDEPSGTQPVPRFVYRVTAGTPGMRYDVHFINSAGQLVWPGGVSVGANGMATWSNATTTNGLAGTGTLEIYEDVDNPNAGNVDPGTLIARGSLSNVTPQSCSLTGMGGAAP
ncbi:ricin-type beta-trefoil lectin domain protein [Agromyces intestinalis]|uniref:Ricin-type beta-trefoil lectin domain protein n=1 Tax=Agromyces intestinalis TaxID=2592652 RepID=A0A5C1YF07_9MICO|nr:RICIN domain-containing protein [Agromyces intestinalis]QEO14085.1 ricin-type beta-trefoil lectin domain protein [Agromyces intestinalis]